jgi:hypothetical protein
MLACSRKAQYQLWIVYPSRDAEAPVDGGVFDIPGNGSPVEVVPIAAKLALLRLSFPARSTLSECPSRSLRNSSYPMIFLALRYWEWGNVPEKTRNEFHAKDATIAKGTCSTLSF